MRCDGIATIIIVIITLCAALGKKVTVHISNSSFLFQTIEFQFLTVSIPLIGRISD